MLVCISQEFQVPDPFTTAPGMPESGSGTPDIPSQNGARPNGSHASGRWAARRGTSRGPSVDEANIYDRRTGTVNDRSDTPPESFLDFLDRLSARLIAKNDTAWPAVVQFAVLVLLLPASVIATVLAAHAAGVPGWAIATGTVTSAGGAGALTVSRRKAGRSGTDQAPGQQGSGPRASRRQGSHRRR
ncbi:hypothetical protein [Streptomyces sp. NPDC101455]|uniref:hypothetical protein n=1 Tax=Streptomyces sp. NPDC101455 TaxID=3366142 RepID=UPI0038258C4C